MNQKKSIHALLLGLDQKRSNLIYLAVFCYLFFVYSSCWLYNLYLITEENYRELYFCGIELTFFLFILALKKAVKSKLLYSILQSLFLSRFIGQFFWQGHEFWYEILLVLLLPILFYFINKIYKRLQ